MVPDALGILFVVGMAVDNPLVVHRTVGPMAWLSIQGRILLLWCLRKRYGLQGTLHRERFSGLLKR